jgi:hypothetical protein
MKTTRLAALLVLLLGTWGCQDIICLADPDGEDLCEENNELASRDLALLGPVAWEGGVAYRSQDASRVTLLHTDGSQARVEQVDVPRDPILLRSLPDRSKLLVLSSQARTLTVLAPDADQRRVDYDLGSPFNALSVSEDGAYAIAYYNQGNLTEQVVSNRNEIAVIDLADANNPAPQRLSLRSFGSRPQGILFAPRFTLRGQERRVAMILSTNYVTLLDLEGFDPENPNANERVVQFTRNDDTTQLNVRQVIWTDDDENDDSDFFAFILTDGSDDIISLNLLPGEGNNADGQVRIQPSLNQLTGGSRPVDIDLFKTSDGKRKLLAVNRSSRDLSVIDVATSDTVLVPLEEPVESLEVYQAINDDTERQEPYALLYNTNGALRSLLFVELETVEVRRTRAVRRLNLPRSIIGLSMTPDQSGLPRALLLHSGSDAFSILNLEGRFVTTLDVSSAISSFAFIEQGQEQLVATPQGQPWLSFVDLATGYPATVRLDEEASSVIIIPGTDTVLVDHNHPLGSVTLLPISDPTRASARTLQSFGAQGLLEQDPH